MPDWLAIILMACASWLLENPWHPLGLAADLTVRAWFHPVITAAVAVTGFALVGAWRAFRGDASH